MGKIELLIEKYEERINELYDLLKFACLPMNHYELDEVNVEIDTLESVVSDLYKVL